MKQKRFIFCMLILATAIISAGPRQYKARTGGVVFRGGYWDTQNDWPPVHRQNKELENTVYVGGYGGWIDFYSRLNDQMFLYCGLGAATDVLVEEEFLGVTETKVKALMPLVFGVRYNLLPLERAAALEPYVSAGGGPYWEHHVHVIDEFIEETIVDVQSNMRLGLYLGGGMFYRATDTFALNFDMKYHLLDLDVDNDFSGIEVGIGFGFFWGNY